MVVEPRVDGGRRRRFGSRPSFSLVVAVMALVASVGGNAAAAVIITSNGQVAAHTIAGANALGGGHKNLIAGTVGTTDLHNGAITAIKLASADRVHKINAIHNGVGSQTTTINVGELTISVKCVGTASSVSITPTFHTSADADMNWSYIQDASGALSIVASGAAYSANSNALPILSYTSTSGDYIRREGQVIYATASRVITVNFHLIARQNLNDLCEMTGTAIPASLK